MAQNSNPKEKDSKLDYTKIKTSTYQKSSSGQKKKNDKIGENTRMGKSRLIVVKT